MLCYFEPLVCMLYLFLGNMDAHEYIHKFWLEDICIAYVTLKMQPWIFCFIHRIYCSRHCCRSNIDYTLILAQILFLLLFSIFKYFSWLLDTFLIFSVIMHQCDMHRATNCHTTYYISDSSLHELKILFKENKFPYAVKRGHNHKMHALDGFW